MSIIARINGLGASALMYGQNHEGRNRVSADFHACDRVTRQTVRHTGGGESGREHISIGLRHESASVDLYLDTHQAAELRDKLDAALAEAKQDAPPAPLTATH